MSVTTSVAAESVAAAPGEEPPDLDPDASDEVGAASLSSRVTSLRTLISLGVTAAVLGIAIWRAPIPWHDTWRQMRSANIGFYVLAIAVYYSSFGVRTARWKLLLRNTGEDVRAPALLEILLSSFFVNCVVPAKMGDVYRAVQLRARAAISGAKSLGTIVAERLLDLFVLMGLLVIAGGITFRDHVPASLVPALIGGAVLCGLGIAGLCLMAAGRGRRLLGMLPDRAVARYEHFRTGTVDAFGRWTEVVPLSVAVWVLEGLRLGFVIIALGFGTEVGPAHFLLVALVAALLTTVPFLPGGLGLVEAGMVAVLTQFGLSTGQATAVALLDRSISYGSLILVGGAVFLFSHARPGRTPASKARAGARSVVHQ
ncbi:MAG TPA: lysylphosphatidylglycerol synthase transmembrane domain-containing protein [Candidatus Dormibacteraeota bacterium]|nr:lysylphosphatidylglycerol synthase transmembrane domain-containing protein [Candidatus Dormibacteraeota bacterium]